MRLKRKNTILVSSIVIPVNKFCIVVDEACRTFVNGWTEMVMGPWYDTYNVVGARYRFVKGEDKISQNHDCENNNFKYCVTEGNERWQLDLAVKDNPLLRDCQLQCVQIKNGDRIEKYQLLPGAKNYHIELLNRGECPSVMDVMGEFDKYGSFFEW